MNLLLVIMVMVINAFFVSIGSIFLKLGAERFHPALTLNNLFLQLKNWRLILGVILYSVSIIPFIYLLRSVELSLLYPLSALGYVCVIFFSWLILKERITTYKIAGIFLIVVGVICVTL